MVTLREAREAKKLTQEELGCKVGKKLSTISSYELGVRIPGIDTARKIAEALEISLDELYFEKEGVKQ